MFAVISIMGGHPVGEFWGIYHGTSPMKRSWIKLPKGSRPEEPGKLCWMKLLSWHSRWTLIEWCVNVKFMGDAWDWSWYIILMYGEPINTTIWGMIPSWEVIYPLIKALLKFIFLFPEVGYGSVFSRETSSPSIQGFLSSKQQVTNVKSPKPISSWELQRILHIILDMQGSIHTVDASEIPL